MDVISALRNSKKGQLKYDRYWAEEGRTKEVLDNITARLSEINISPKALVLAKLDVVVEQCDGGSTIGKIPSPVDSRKKVAKQIDNPPDTYFFQMQSEMELPILEYEECRLKSVQDIFEEKKREYENYSNELQQQIDQQYHLLKRKNELDARRREVNYQKFQEAYLQKAKEKEMLQKEHYQTQAKKLSAKVKEAEMKQKKAEEEMRKREQEQQELLSQLYNCQKEAQNLISKSIEKLKFCEHQNYLKVSISERNSQLSKMMLDISTFVNETEVKVISIEDILNANLLVKRAYEALQEITNYIDQTRTKAQHEQEKLLLKQHLQKDPTSLNKGHFKDEAPKILGLNDPKYMFPESTVTKSDTSGNFQVQGTCDEGDFSAMEESSGKNADKSGLLSSLIAPDAAEHYVSVNEQFKKFEDLIQPFIDDIKNKQCRFELQKKINSPINKIFSGSKSHVKSQINQLLTLLSSKTVEINRKSVPFAEGSLIYSYSLNVVAKQLVTHGEVEIASHSAYAFPFAAAVAAVWAKHPSMGPLLLGHFYNKCPYLVPYYPPRQKDQSDADYYKSMGYRSPSEDLTAFLKRMGGYARLYSAIILAPLPSDYKVDHPHGLSWGWKWLSRILNLDPRPHITATLLYEFLYIAGSALEKAYGKQFKKLLHVLCKDYFIKIKSVMDPSETKTPVERLEQFLQLTIKKGHISQPEGILSSDFWNKM